MADVQNDWEINPEGYLQNEDGSFVMKADGTPKKRAGRKKGTVIRGYNYSSEQKAKIAARRAVKKQEKDLATLSKKVISKKAKLKNRKQIFEKLDAISDNQVTEEHTLKDLPKPVKDFLEESKEDYEIEGTGLTYHFTSRCWLIHYVIVIEQHTEP